MKPASVSPATNGGDDSASPEAGESLELRASIVSSSTRVLLVLLIAAGLAILGLGFTSGPPVAARQTQKVGSLGRSAPLFPGKLLLQTLSPQENSLSEIAVTFFTFAGSSTDCVVEATLRDGQRKLGSQKTECSEINDGVPTGILRLDPIPNSAGRSLTLELKEVAGSTQAVEPLLFAGAVPPATLNGQELPSSLSVRPLYSAGNWYSTIWEVWSRSSVLEPWWFGRWIVLPIVAAGLAGMGLMAQRRRRHLRIVGLVLFVVAKGVVWVTLVPAVQSPDEASHYQYSQYLVEEHRLPSVIRREDRATDDEYSRELQVAGKIGRVDAVPPGDRPDFTPSARTRLNREQPVTSSGSPTSAGYSPLYYAPAGLMYLLAPDRFADRIALMRLWSVALGAIAAVGVFRLGRVLLRSDSGALLLAVSVALQPVWSQQTAVVNNDALAVATGAWLLYFAARMQRDLVVRGRSPRTMRFAAMVGVGAMALLAKPTMLPVLLILPLAAFLGHWGGRDSGASGSRRAAARDIALSVLPAVLIYMSWSAARAALGLGAQSLASGDRVVPKDTYVQILLSGRLSYLRLTWVDRLWGGLGKLNAPLLSNTYFTLVELVTLGILLGLVLLSARWIRTRSADVALPSEARSDRLLLGLMVAAVLGSVVFLHLVEWRYFQVNGRADLLQGRYLLPVLPAVFAIPALIARGLFPRVRAAVAAVPMTALSVVLQLASLSWIAERYYT